MNFNLSPSDVAVCPTCDNDYTNKYDVSAIGSIGECLACDHVRGDSDIYFENEMEVII